MKNWLENLIIAFAVSAFFFSLFYAALWLLFCFTFLEWFNPFATEVGRLAGGFVVLASLAFAASEEGRP